MKKRVAAVLLACALSCATVVGFSGCKLGVPKGDEVSEEVWKESIKKTDDVLNYTLEAVMDVDVEVEGTVYHSEYVDGKQTNVAHAVESAYNLQSNMKVLYDKEGKKAYRKSESKAKSFESDGYGRDSGYQKEETEESNKSNSESYYEPLGTTQYSMYKCTSRGDSERVTKKTTNTKENISEKNEESDWSYSETSGFMENYIEDMFGDTTFYKTGDGNGASFTLVDLYDSFTFSKGVYTAELFRKVEVFGDYYVDIFDYIPVTVKLSFNAEKRCVTGVGLSTKGSGRLSRDNMYDVEYSYDGYSVYSITDIGVTDVEKKKSNDIKNAPKA